MANLTASALKHGTDALAVMHGGGLVLNERFDRSEDNPMYLMSMTKTVVGMLIGRAVTLGHIDSVDQPVCTWYPEWRQGRKCLITIRHLLTHTSGLQNVPRPAEEIYPSPDFVQLALCAEVDDEPGQVFAYNNKAANLVPGVLHRATGARADDFAHRALFAPLGIERVDWDTDSVGNPRGMSELLMCAADLARVLDVLCADGLACHGGGRLLSSAWVQQTLSPATNAASDMGLMTFLRRGTGSDRGRIIGCWHSGSGGQWYWVDLPSQTVVVRQVAFDHPGAYEEPVVWRDFVQETVRMLLD